MVLQAANVRELTVSSLNGLIRKEASYSHSGRSSTG